MAPLKDTYTDYENYYVNKGYILTFLHIPSNRSTWFKGLVTYFSDNYQSNWNDEEVYGRMDPISTFKNTRRTISITWDVVAAHVDEAKINMQKVSLLLSMLYPVYSGEDASSITTAPLFKISFANLMHDLNGSEGGGINSGIVGKLDSLNFTPNMAEQFFDVSNGILHPQSLTISTNITVFHTHALGWNQDKTPRNKKFPYGENIDMDNQDGTRNVGNPLGITQKSDLVEQEAASQNKVLDSISPFFRNNK